VPRRGEQVLLAGDDEGGRRDAAEPVERVECQVRVPLLRRHRHLLLVLWEEGRHRLQELQEVGVVEELR
jgi:hypothetical protein